MSDILLLKNRNDTTKMEVRIPMLYAMNNGVSAIRERPFVTEKEMQTFCEKNIEKLLNLHFVATEFSVSTFRFDTLAYNESTNSFVIIEYKNTQKFSVIDQGYSYIAAMQSHKADFVLKYDQVFSASKGTNDFDWTQVRVIFIAPQYTTYQIGSIQFKNLPMELWRIKRYENNLLEFIHIEPAENSASISGFVPNAIIGNGGGTVVEGEQPTDVGEVVVYSEEDRMEDGSEEMQELYKEIREMIKSLDSEISIKPTKLYIGFLFQNHNLIDVKLQKRSLIMWLNAPYGIYDDPYNLIKDVTHIGHHGNGNCQIRIENRNHLGALNDLLNLHYQIVKGS